MFNKGSRESNNDKQYVVWQHFERVHYRCSIKGMRESNNDKQYVVWQHFERVHYRCSIKGREKVTMINKMLCGSILKGYIIGVQ